MDFKDYWEIGCFGEYHDIYAKNLAEKFYKAGQQSKQEEDNKLQVRINELQKRIDDALYHTVNHGGYDDLTHIINILKGE